MRKNLLLLVAFCSINAAFAQFYVSASGGYAMSSAGMKLGEITTTTSTENSYGSYGEGMNAQLRTGYFFNNTFGIELGFGYLHGADQTISKVDIPALGINVNAIARARAYGLTTAIVYNFTDNLYGRFGALIKLGGKTEAVASSKTTFSDDQAAGLGLPSGSYTQTNYVEDYHGVLPLGFVGAFGYKYSFSDSFGLFVEAEYMGISVKRNDSEIVEFNTDIMLPDGTVAVPSYYDLDNLPPGYTKTTDYVDELPNNNTDPSKELSQKVPYSSFGINIGVTYKFSKK